MNKEIERRTESSASSPTPKFLLRLAGAVLVEIHDEWAVTDRRYLFEGCMKLLTPTKEVAPTAELTAWSQQAKTPRRSLTPRPGAHPSRAISVRYL